MTLSGALNSSLTSLRTAQDSLNVIANNIANVNTPGFSRRIAQLNSLSEEGNLGAGVGISEITTNVNQLLIKTTRAQSTSVANLTLIEECYQNIQTLFGNPDSKDSIINNITDFFTSLESLTNDPELSLLKLNFINDAKILANNISNLSTQLHQLRYNADLQVSTSVNNINNLLQQLSLNNKAISADYYAGIYSADLVQQQDNYLNSLAQELDIYTYYNQDGTVQISASGGTSLLNQSNYVVQYTPATSLTAFINYAAFGPVNVLRTNFDGTTDSSSLVSMITGGYSEVAGTATTVKNNILSGKLNAAQQLRDVQIPHIIDQLDVFANNLSQQVNAVHNSGGGFPSATSLTGTRTINSTTNRSFNGQTMIALVDSQGQPVPRPDGTLLPPLVLDFTKIASGATFGQMTDQTIINEINQYFNNNYISNRASLGNIYDIKLATTSNFSTIPGGHVSFDLELENDSQLNSTVLINSVTVSGGCVGLTSALPTTPFMSVAGTRERTNLPFTVSFAGGGGGPYNVAVNIQVTDTQGNVSTGVINYLVNDNPGTSLVQNNRYAPSSAGGGATLSSNVAVKGAAFAQIVDTNGNHVNPGKNGFLSITANNNYSIIMNDLTSQDLGFASTISNNKVAATNKGFAAFYELNDFFVRNSTVSLTTSNAPLNGTAINMSIRSDILANPSLLSTGQLTKSSVTFITEVQGTTAANGTLIFNNNPSVGDTITVDGQIFTFVANASLNNEITIGSNLAHTLDNIAAKLSASNVYTSGTVNKASYSSNSVDTLMITFNSLGIQGNLFAISGNFATAGVSFNDTNYTTTPSGTLIGGAQENTTVEIQPWSYEMAIGSKASIDNMVALRNKVITYNSAGNLPQLSTTIIGYFSSILSYNIVQTKNSVDVLEDQNSILSGYKAQIDSLGGVDLDQEIANTLQFQSAYIASTKIISIVEKLYDSLFASF